MPSRGTAFGVGFLVVTFGAAAEPHRVRAEHDLLSYGVVETTKATERVRVVHDLPFKTVADRVLGMDVSYPPDVPTRTHRPAVVFVNGVGDRPGAAKLRTWGQYTSWPRLLAASGLIAVTFDARGEEANLEDVRDAFAYVRAHAAELSIDASRIGAWACSANVRSALALLTAADAPKLQVAVLYYGAGEVAAVPAEPPVLLVRAGRDRPAMNEQIDRLAAQAVAANAPWTVINLPGAHHGFDVLDDNDESRVAIRRTIAFLTDRLDPQPSLARAATPAREALVHFFAGEWAEAETLYTSYVASHPDDADALVLLGNAQVELKKYDAASPNLRRAIELDPSIGEAWAMLGRIAVEEKNYMQATDLLTKAIERMPDDAESHRQLGKARLAQGDPSQAVAVLERAVELAPGNGWAWNDLAHAYLAAKRPGEAASSFERVLVYAPTNPVLLYNTACAYALSGNADKAIEMLDRSIQGGFRDRGGMSADPDLASVRSDPRFAGLLARITNPG
jgi:Flp pilus assembly protein TadD